MGPITEQAVKVAEAAGGYVKEIRLVSGWTMGCQVKTIVLQVVVGI